MLVEVVWNLFLERKHFFPFLNVDISLSPKSPLRLAPKLKKVNRISQAVPCMRVMLEIQSAGCVGTEQRAICVLHEWQEMMSALRCRLLYVSQSSAVKQR